jgi:hypothetical protein
MEEAKRVAIAELNRQLFTFEPIEARPTTWEERYRYLWMNELNSYGSDEDYDY